MARPKGAKNKPKSLKEILQMLEADAQKSGKKISLSFSEAKQVKIGNEIAVDAPGVIKQAPAVAEDTMNLILDKDEKEDAPYKCGVCGATFAAPVEKCPECGSVLEWE